MDTKIKVQMGNLSYKLRCYNNDVVSLVYFPQMCQKELCINTVHLKLKPINIILELGYVCFLERISDGSLQIFHMKNKLEMFVAKLKNDYKIHTLHISQIYKPK